MGGKDLHSSGTANKYPVVGVNWHKAKGEFEICFCHESPRAQGAQNLYSIIHPYILKGIGVFRDVIVYAVTLRVRAVIDGSPLCGVFLGDHTYGTTLEIREWWGREGARDHPTAFPC